MHERVLQNLHAGSDHRLRISRESIGSLLGLVLIVALIILCVTPAGAQRRARKSEAKKDAGKSSAPAKSLPPTGESGGRTRLTFDNGATLVAEDAWADSQSVWYKTGGITQVIDRTRIKSAQPITTATTKAEPAEVRAQPTAPVLDIAQPKRQPASFLIFFTSGARMKVESVSETETGVWYHLGGLTVFVDRSRIDHIDREDANALDSAPRGGWLARGWTTGNTGIDELIRQNGERFGVDPYLIFCVMEQESQFRPRALSPKGARGLMQLMPATGRRFGVRRPFDPRENIAGGTQYLKELLQRFNGRVDLVLASYNAGEGAVEKYGRAIPPYSETRTYVKRISARYSKKPGGGAQGN
jgi:hypothetical protein